MRLGVEDETGGWHQSGWASGLRLVVVVEDRMIFPWGWALGQAAEDEDGGEG